MARYDIVNVVRACLLLIALVAASPGTTPVAAAGPPDSNAGAATTERVLFIGNSHTRRHGGIDWLVGNFAASEVTPRAFESDVLAEGGVTLAYHWQAGAPDRIRAGSYDAVVLQGWLPGANTETVEPFLEYTRRFDEVIRSTGARTVLFMTWPSEHDDWSTLDDAVAAHRQLESELGATVAPAAVAFARARAERPELELIDPDGIHATWEGAYLAAATVYATLFERDPEDLDYDFGVEPGTAAFLRRIAWETLQEWQAAADD
jgi:hypothetical protein